MKKLVFCFDGTWNHLSAPNPTNIVMVAQGVAQRTPMPNPIVQIIHYDSGVGTGTDDHWRGGLFGEGLIDKVVDAYTFLVLNYEPGDELFLFGFSRGAFTARAFVGFVRNLGIIQRKQAARIADAAAIYKSRLAGGDHDTEELLRFRSKYSPEICVDAEENDWRIKNCPGYTAGKSLVVRIKYLGVWDTVGAVGLPSDLIFAKWANKREQYFDTDLSSMVVSGRHAVSIDEQRTTFKPTLWPNVRALNESLGYTSSASDAPYQQRWFPGDHGSIGGGGDIRGLSDRALVWVLDGAEKMGLKLDSDEGSPLFALRPDDLAPLENMTAASSTVSSAIEGVLLLKAPRTGGPIALEELSASALARWQATKEQLPEGTLYRPKSLEGAAPAIEASQLPSKSQVEHPSVAVALAAQPTAGRLYKVIYGDTLGGLAQKLYGHANRAGAILEANQLTDPDRIFIGQLIFLPIL